MAFVRMCFGKKEDDPASKKNAEIEKTLREDKKKQEREVKILLLGEIHYRAARNYNHLTSACRRWRKWKVDCLEADAADPRWWLFTER